MLYVWWRRWGARAGITQQDCGRVWLSCLPLYALFTQGLSQQTARESREGSRKVPGRFPGPTAVGTAGASGCLAGGASLVSLGGGACRTGGEAGAAGHAPSFRVAACGPYLGCISVVG